MMRQLKVTEAITSRESASLEKYLSEIAKIPRLTPDEEVTLGRQIKKGDQGALDALVKSNLRFVVSVAKKYQGQQAPLSDLVNQGNLGLIKAATLFDETRGFKFISFAVWWIRQSILQYLQQENLLVRLPLNKSQLVSAVQRKTDQLSHAFERDPTPEEIADAMGESEENIYMALQLRHKYSVSTDEPPPGQDDMDVTFGDLLTDQEMRVDETLDKESLAERVRLVIKDKLPSKYAEILCMYYGIGYAERMTPKNISKQKNITESRVKQIVENMQLRLRTFLPQLKSF